MYFVKTKIVHVCVCLYMFVYIFKRLNMEKKKKKKKKKKNSDFRGVRNLFSLFFVRHILFNVQCVSPGQVHAHCTG